MKKKEILNIGFFKYYFIKFCFCKKSNFDRKSLQILNFAKNKIFKKIDILYYLKHIHTMKRFMKNYNNTLKN